MRRYWFKAGYGILLSILFLAQISLGANLAILVATTLVACLTFIPLSQSDISVIDGIYLVMIQYYSTTALFFKSIVGQPLQQNLISPTASTVYLIVGVLSITAGYLAARTFRIKLRPMIRMESAFNSKLFERLLAKPVFIIGFLFFSLHSLLKSDIVGGVADQGGFGGFGFFFFLLPMAWAMQIALCVRNPHSRFQRYAFYAMGLAALALTLFGNVKVIFIQFIITLVVGVLAFGIRVKPRVMVALTIPLAVLVLYVQPLVQITRTNIAQLKPIERVDAAGKVLSDASYNPITLFDEASQVAQSYKLGYSGSYFYPAALNVDRFTMILPIDQVVRAIPTLGTIGIRPAITEIIEVTLPSVFIHKTNISTSDVIAWHYGFRVNGSISRPVTGLIASSAAAYGLLGILVLPSLYVFFGFSIVSLMAWNMKGNPWAVFIFMNFVPLVEKDIGAFITIFTQALPYVLLTCLALWIVWALRYPRAAAQAGARLVPKYRNPPAILDKASL